MTENNEEELPNAFDADHLFPSLLIQMTRVYDVGLAILKELNPEAANNLLTWHEAGNFISPPPSYNEEQETNG